MGRHLGRMSDAISFDQGEGLFAVEPIHDDHRAAEPVDGHGPAQRFLTSCEYLTGQMESNSPPVQFFCCTCLSRRHINEIGDASNFRQKCF